MVFVIFQGPSVSNGSVEIGSLPVVLSLRSPWENSEEEAVHNEGERLGITDCTIKKFPQSHDWLTQLYSTMLERDLDSLTIGRFK
jgi:hypothetical protein